MSTSTLAASNTSVRNSTAPPIPAGSPVSVKRSLSENTKSIRAVCASIGTEVARRSPKGIPATGSLPSAAEFCQASTTWISG
ncbi:hypothetical protein MCNS_29540 [Mycobacterium conspicuum]|uniref:Uncharacterized protein n=1 Tax=Mycobacterium conspicuum TaxID=44010 RepID=A0A7I7YG93_9MYCO|nr:hypothetical protein MCNS_29540 [Mycobacterium conspicuum]